MPAGGAPGKLAVVASQSCGTARAQAGSKQSLRTDRPDHESIRRTIVSLVRSGIPTQRRARLAQPG